MENIFWEKWKKRSVEMNFFLEKVEKIFWEKWKKRSVEARADAYSRLKMNIPKGFKASGAISIYKIQLFPFISLIKSS